MTTLYLDLETYCETPIKDGTHRYAEDAEVMLWAWAIDDGPVHCWDATAHPEIPLTLTAAMRSADEFVAHQSAFDRTVLRHCFPTLGRLHDTRLWRDTMVKALAHSLPGGLARLCDIFGIGEDDAKLKDGRQLVQLFCKPRPKNQKLRRATRGTHPEEWARFIEYAKGDIRAMRALDRKIPGWNYGHDSEAARRELALWHLDQRINDRGVCIDTDLVHAAIEAASREKLSLADRVQEATSGDVSSATKRDQMLTHILAEYGVGLPDLQASTLQRRIDDPDLPAELRTLLEIRLQASATSVTKYKTLERCISSDGRLRGSLQFCGASRTGRWAGRLFQPQNLARQTMKPDAVETAIEAIKAGSVDLVYDNPMAVLSNAVRGAIVASPRKQLVVSDLSNIEGRAMAWLAGEDWKLEAFREYDAGTGADLYRLAYARAFGIPVGDVDGGASKGPQRQIGKVMELMLQYEGGVGAFLTGAATYDIDLDEMAHSVWHTIPEGVKREALGYLQWRQSKKLGQFDLPDDTFIVCESLKRLWRGQHPEVCAWWSELQDAVVSVTITPGNAVAPRRVRVWREKAWLRVQLPSGRCLCYPSPKIEDGKWSYQGTNQYSRQWQRLKSYGGKIAENITQAVARDVMAWNFPAIEAAGYEMVLSVHDEVVTEAPDTVDYGPDELSRLLATVPPWAEGLPLAAAGYESQRYRKD